MYLAKQGKCVWEKVYNTSLFVVYQDSVFNNSINVMRQTNFKKIWQATCQHMKHGFPINYNGLNRFSKYIPFLKQMRQCVTGIEIGFKLQIPSHWISSTQFLAWIVNVMNEHHCKAPYNDHSIVVLEITTCERTLPLNVEEKQ